MRATLSPLDAFRPHLRTFGVACAIALVVLPAEAGRKDRQIDSADDLAIVDCLLPQKLRRLGRNASYLQPRQPIRTTAVDCRIRGGEYTEPDQATYATSLAVWLPRAEDGDPAAQYAVGQIFEKGLGTEPDYTNAAAWYRKAADQGYASAQVVLGSFYEEGLGVEADAVEAMNWYRQAAGLSEDLVVLEQGELDDLRADLAAKEIEVRQLETELGALREQLDATDAASKEQQQTLQQIVARLETDLQLRQRELDENRERVGSLEARLQTVSARTTASGPRSGPRGTARLADIQFGEYHALVIGNSEYQELPRLDSAAEDAQAVADLLRDRYGFEVTLLLDADRFAILSALNDLREGLDANDNLLVYYAGHGERNASGQAAYWQPVDAKPRSLVNWIPNELITEHLDLIPAKHVFVVADSVYSGLRTRSAVARLPRGMTAEERYFHIKLLLDKRARLVLASGADIAPSQNFASSFLDVLTENDDVLEASRLYTEMNERLAAESDLEFAPMKWARGDLSDFFFVPTAAR